MRRAGSNACASGSMIIPVAAMALAYVVLLFLDRNEKI